VWLINTEKLSGSANMEDENGEKWWDQIELTKLILASNKIKILPKDIKQLYTLIALDVNKDFFF
jgi:hypothetical protein